MVNYAVNRSKELKCASVNISSIFSESNKRHCLSVKRALLICYECDLYEHCESKVVNSEYDNLVNKKRELYKTIDNINEQISLLGR
jgi:hypothetical protein